MLARAHVGFFAAALASGACASISEAPGRADAELIHGAPAALAEFPSTVHLAGGCTAAKIAPRTILTAAHCVLDLGTLEPRYDRTHPLAIGRDVGGLHTPYAVEVRAHPRWVSACRETLCSISAVTAKLDAPDVAVVELVDADLEDVPSTPIDLTPIAESTPVILVGFGCTDGVHLADPATATRLMTGEGVVLRPERGLHEGSPVRSADLPIYSGNYLLTASEAGVALCPGDSGGPLYQKKPTGLVIVGVNANYTLRPDEEDPRGVPVTSWHTRLDRSSRHDVAQFLGGRGGNP